MWRIIICGSRHWTDPAPIARVIQALPPDTVVITGGAPGADALAHRLALQRGLRTGVFPAAWATEGRRAGPLRNQRMLEAGADAVYAFRCPGASPGTDHMVRIARAAHVPVRVITPDLPEPQGDTPLTAR
ncbi:SLOG family protein [Sulfobacillus sp. hq2]|uniref:SLOG family protein n=1 Tax=Sulfobacillus sp. hq2 TaxID=2039167 RepID=UPI000CD20B5E|nr:SLOG family protein [Sulfobacillus sp. hq2]POB12174.1 hypothetical protein CO251_00680 [Sulfobacillus sp. hq2]